LDGSIYVGQTTKGRRRGYGVYMISQQCLVHTMSRSDDGGSTNAKHNLEERHRCDVKYSCATRMTPRQQQVVAHLVN
jgi:hypothetical protein